MAWQMKPIIVKSCCTEHVGDRPVLPEFCASPHLSPGPRANYTYMRKGTGEDRLAPLYLLVIHNDVLVFTVCSTD